MTILNRVAVLSFALLVISGCSIKEKKDIEPGIQKESVDSKETPDSATNDRKKFLSIEENKLKVEIADTDEKKEKGLMFRDKLPDDEGMLFIYSEETCLRFWMKNTKIPLSIAFIRNDGVISEIRDMKPYDLTTIESREKVCYALEVNQGYFEKNKIKPGDKIKGLK